MSDFNTKAVPKTDSMFGYDPALADPSHTQFLRGVIWADDPEGLLFDNPRNTYNYSSGAMWYSHFSDGEKGKFDTMTARSHFGDLQFFHGMASSDAEAPATTKSHMLNWARFLIKVAKGVITTDTKLKDISEVSSLFSKQGDQTVKELFGWGKGEFVKIRQRAVGALFHMIQDSYAHGHVERNSAGEISEFHAYGGQDEHKHGEYDFLGGSWYQDLGERLKQTKGALERDRRVRDGAADDRRGRLLGRHRRLHRQERPHAVVERAAGRGGHRAREATAASAQEGTALPAGQDLGARLTVQPPG